MNICRYMFEFGILNGHMGLRGQRNVFRSPNKL
jgi:hypothetical protein